jgi:hypothetical protein
MPDAPPFFRFLHGFGRLSTPAMRCSLTLLSLALLTLTAFAENQEITIPAGNAPALKLEIPKDAKATTKGAKTSFLLKDAWVFLWSVPTAKTVAEAVPQVATIIKSEFTDFALTDTKHLTIAGQEADHLFGKGLEADDGDPGAAEVVIFIVGKHVFAACVHGEKEEAAKKRPSMLALLKSAKAP